MIQLERQNNIIALLMETPILSVKEIAKKLYTSESSIRRDVESMEKQGLCHRTYGGVMLPQYKNAPVPLVIRDTENSEKKEIVAKRAAELIKDDTTVLMDASSTTRRIIKYIPRTYRITLVTNNLRIFNELDHENITLLCTGGVFNKKNRAFGGATAEDYLRRINADICFFSCQGISESGEITDISESDVSFRRTMMARSKRKVFLCDSEKIGIQKIYTLCTKDDVTDIICDKTLPWE